MTLPAPSIASLLDGHSDAPVVAWGGVTLNRRRLRRMVDALARTLEGHPGEPVAVIAPNVPAVIVGLFAVWRAGGVAVPLNTRLRHYELEHILRDAQPWAIVSLSAHAGFDVATVVQQLAPEIPTLALHVVTDELGNTIAEHRHPTGIGCEELDAEAATILYTSGTTGEPKGAIERHSKGLSVARSFGEVLGPHADEPCAYIVPVSHCFGLACLLATVGAGSLAVLVDVPGSLAPLLEAMRDHRVGVLHGSPALFSAVLRGADELPAWRSGFIAGSACPPELVAALDRRGARMLGQYGLTEIGNVTACRLDDPSETRHHTVGRSLGGYEVRAVPVPDADQDEIQVRSAFLWPSLFRRAWSSAELTDDGWLRTGDLGTIDANGNVTIAGRSKHVVHTAGFSVHPAEVEGFLQTYPGVVSAVVVGIPHPELGEALAAYVVITPGTSLDRRNFMRFCRAGIAGYKVPNRVEVVRELPLLASGKPDRAALTRDAQAL